MDTKYKHILVVEDSPAYARMLEQLLGSSLPEARLSHVECVAAALRFLQCESVDVVVLDLMLPDSEGVRGILRIQDVDDLLPVIVLTSTDNVEMALEALKAGAQDYLCKNDLDMQGLARSIRYSIERKQSERQLREHVRLLREKDEALHRRQKLEAIGSLASGVAHEFNNLLQIIIGCVSMAREQLATTHKAGNDLDFAIEAAQRAAAITRQLLSFGCQKPAACRTISVKETITKFADMIHPLLGEHIELRILPIDPSLAIHADPTQIGQVLINLCINARDAMPSGGAVTLAAEAVELSGDRTEHQPLEQELQPGRYVVLQVSDTGTGIPTELRPRIFEPFFSTKEVGQGAGLGLATAYGIVKQHGGWTGYSTEEAIGTTFSVYLPAKEANEFDGPALEVEDAHEAPGGNETVLVAEDELGVRLVAQRMLEDAGYRTVAADNGEEALQVFARHRHEISLVLLDVMMPKRTGHEVCKAIRAEVPNMPVIFCTGYFPNGEGNLLPELSDAAFLGKPFDRNRLLASVREALDQRNVAAALSV